MKFKLALTVVLLLSAGLSFGDIEKVSLADFFLKANSFADRDNPDYLLTKLRIVDRIDVTRTAQREGKLLQSHFPIGSTLLVLQAMDMPERAPYIYYVLFSKEEFKAYQKEYDDDVFYARFAAISGVKYKNFAVKTILPGVMNNFWVFVPTSTFKRWKADKFGDNEYKEPDPVPAADTETTSAN